MQMIALMAEIEELLPCERDAHAATGPPPMSKGHKWPLQHAAVAPVGRGYMERQSRGMWRAEWRHASKKFASKVKKLDSQAVHFTVTTEKGTPAVYYWFEGEGTQ